MTPLPAFDFPLQRSAQQPSGEALWSAVSVLLEPAVKSIGPGHSIDSPLTKNRSQRRRVLHEMQILVSMAKHSSSSASSKESSMSTSMTSFWKPRSPMKSPQTHRPHKRIRGRGTLLSLGHSRAPWQKADMGRGSGYRSAVKGLSAQRAVVVNACCWRVFYFWLEVRPKQR